MKAGTGLATSQQGAWQGGGRQHQPSGISLKEGRLFSPFNPLAGWLSSSCWGLRHRPLSPQLQNSLGGSSGLCTFPGFRLPPPSAPPPFLSPVPAQPPAAGECLTLLDLISNPLTFSSARQAWVQGNVTTPLPPAPRRPLQPQQPTRPLPDCTGGRQGPAADPGRLAPPTQTPSAGTAPPAPSLAFFTWLCKREGARRCRQCCPVRPPARGPWYGPRPRGGQRGEGPALEGVPDTAPLPFPPSSPRPSVLGRPSHVDLCTRRPASWGGLRVPQSWRGLDPWYRSQSRIPIPLPRTVRDCAMGMGRAHSRSPEWRLSGAAGSSISTRLTV